MKEIQLTQGKVALVDDSDYEWLNQWKWHYLKPSNNNTGYAVRAEGGRIHRKYIFMHRIIMNTPDGFETNHIDFNGLNNQRYNLENTTPLENHRHRQKPKTNTSGFIGVHRNGPGWEARIHIYEKCLYLGTYQNKEDAARAYDEAARKHFGKFAHTNF